MQEIFREHVRRTAQVPHGWMSSRYGAGIVDTEALLKSTPAASVRLGFGPTKHPSLLGFPLPVRLSRDFMRATSGRYSALLVSGGLDLLLEIEEKGALRAVPR